MAYDPSFKKRILKHCDLSVSNISQVSSIRNVPRRTIYRWKERCKKYGESGLQNRKPGAKATNVNSIFSTKVIELWHERPRGVHKIWLDLQRLGYGVSERQLRKIYRREGFKMNKRKRPSQIKFVKYEWPEPNMLWHVDWTECPFTKNKLIAFIDDYSRYIVHAEYFVNATTENTILAFQIAMQKYGKPQAILSDNGVQFTPARAESGPFSRFCEENGIKHILGRVHHPQTNGKIERWFGTYKLEFQHGKDTLDTFLKFYNEERRHQGIGYIVPLQRYRSVINAV
jgi:putative transposase